MRGDADLYNLIKLPTNKPFKLQSCLNRLLRPRRGKRELRGDASSCCVWAACVMMHARLLPRRRASMRG